MKKIFLILSLFFPLNFFCPIAEAQTRATSTAYVITVNAENAGSEWIFLTQRKRANLVNIDSAKTTVFPVVFMGKQDIPELLYLKISGSNTLIPVFVENSEISVFADFENPSLTKVEGSRVHKEFELYNAGLFSITSENDSLYKDYIKASKSKDSTKMELLMKRSTELEQAEAEYNRNYVLKNNNSYVSAYVLRRVMFNTSELPELRNLIAALDKSLLKSDYIIELQEKISVLEKVAIGQKFTDIVLPGADGNEMKLSDFIGSNVVLVDFWAAWCGPCRRENPNVVKAYQDFHDKGFDVVGVSFDTNEKAWKDAIQNDKLIWHQMSDLMGWKSKAAELYGVRSIPHTVLLDKDGIIIAKNLRGEQLREKLSELLD